MGPEEYFTIRPFGEDHAVQINRQDLSHIIEARVTELFKLIHQEIKRSGYDGLLPAGLVLTGGSSMLPGIKRLASSVMGVPVRAAQPENLIGLVDKLNSPAYSTSVGLLYWGFNASAGMTTARSGRKRRVKGEPNMIFANIKEWIKRLLP